MSFVIGLSLIKTAFFKYKVSSSKELLWNLSEANLILVNQNQLCRYAAAPPF